MPVTEELARRHCIPIVYTRGTHYEVGFDVVSYYFNIFILHKILIKNSI